MSVDLFQSLNLNAEGSPVAFFTSSPAIQTHGYTRLLSRRAVTVILQHQLSWMAVTLCQVHSQRVVDILSFILTPVL
jgi:hypothetical protein